MNWLMGAPWGGALKAGGRFLAVAHDEAALEFRPVFAGFRDGAGGGGFAGLGGELFDGGLVSGAGSGGGWFRGVGAVGD